MADAAIALHVLQEILGHQSIETTKGYLHPDHRHLAEAARQANQFPLRSPHQKGYQPPRRTPPVIASRTPLRVSRKGSEHGPARNLVHSTGTFWCTSRASRPNGIGPLRRRPDRAERASGPASDHVQKRRSPGESCLSPGLLVGMTGFEPATP